MYRYNRNCTLIYFKLLLLNLVLLLLFPLLLVQGMWVRKRTVRLPEPDGERTFENSGFTMDQGLNVIVLGDSAAAGVGAKNQKHALSGLLFSSLSKRRNARLVVKAKTGYTSHDVLHMLNDAPAEQFDIALISVGVNDVTHFTSMGRWRRQCKAIQTLLATKFQCRLVIFSELPPLHLFPAIVQPLRWLLGQRAILFNLALQQTVTLSKRYANSNSVFLPLDIMYREPNLDVESGYKMRFQDMKASGFMATDGFHPSSKAYGLWVERAMAVLHEQKQLS